MKKFDVERLKAVCYSLAKATSATVRLYRGGECLYYYSVYHLQPDPALPFLPRLLSPEQTAGVFTTPVGQYYGYLALGDATRLIVGPSRIAQGEPPELEELLFRLGIGREQRTAYVRSLRCMPALGIERVGWLVSFLALTLEGRELAPGELRIEVLPEGELPAGRAVREDEPDNIDTTELLKQGYHYELLLRSYVEQGRPDRLLEVFSAPPNFMQGHLSDDTIRQLKDIDICAAAIAGRAAIAGGLNSLAAFALSDRYIQTAELTRDAEALRKLQNDIFLGFAREVAQIKGRLGPEGQTGGVYAACAEYVSQNIYGPIRVRDVADALGYTRSYLSCRFKEEAGITLTQYILQEKIAGTQHMLRFTDRSLTDIAQLFSFSSQSYFQSVFKRLTGQTPMEYRRTPQEHRSFS